MKKQRFLSRNICINNRTTKRLICLLIGNIICWTLYYYFIQQNVIISDSELLPDINDNRIPSIVHFVLGQGDKNPMENSHPFSSSFSFVNYLNFLAARRQIRPKKFYVHYYREPKTFWWNRAKHDPEIDMILIKTHRVEHIYNNPVTHHSHRADIIRLEVLMKYGGIYLDIDVLTLRSFDSLLNLSDVIMAHQDNDTNTACNAVIIAKKNATFLKRFYDAYQSFDEQCWDCHSVGIPGELATIYSKEIIVLPTETFFRPTWNEQKIFESNDYNFSSNYASHLWNEKNNDYLIQLTPKKILNGNFTLARMFLQAIGKKTFEKLDRIFIGNSIS